MLLCSPARKPAARGSEPVPTAPADSMKPMAKAAAGSNLGRSSSKRFLQESTVFSRSRTPVFPASSTASLTKGLYGRFYHISFGGCCQAVSRIIDFYVRVKNHAGQLHIGTGRHKSYFLHIILAIIYNAHKTGNATCRIKILDKSVVLLPAFK